MHVVLLSGAAAAAAVAGGELNENTGRPQMTCC